MRRIAVLNRGEPALRFLRALKEFNIEHDMNMKGVALFTNVDVHAPFVRFADESVSLGEPVRSNGVSSYCDHEFIIEVLLSNNIDAVWPGWGFLSEDALFVSKLEEANITFIGPSSKAMYALGDKIASKYMAQNCGVPLSPWAEISEDEDISVFYSQAKRIGYPLMVKASGGGGGRGITKVHSDEELLPAIKGVREAVAKVFGQGGVLMEACVERARHIEVQIVVNAEGKAFSLGVRDCSIQRKNQKVIEEAPSPILPPEVQDELCSSACRLAQQAQYRGVGTAEFLYQPHSGVCTFLEVNSRLQVEHTITELIMGCDLVKAQIRIAMGMLWVPPSKVPGGHAIELRVNAENPEKDFQPSPGLLRIFRAPSGPGIRVDSGVIEGSDIPVHFDSMIAKIIAWAPTRRQAIARVVRACQELDAVVEDGATNQAFLCDVLSHKDFISGAADTSWIARAMNNGELRAVGCEAEALITAAILEYQLQHHSALNSFFADVQDGIPQNIPSTAGRTIELRLRDKSCTLHVYCVRGNTYLIEAEGSLYLCSLQLLSNGVADLLLEGEHHKVLYAYGYNGIAIEVNGYSHQVERAAGGTVKAPAPAVVVSVHVQEGDEVQAGDRLCTLEAMKMEMGVHATQGGRVRAVLCLPNQQVSVGQPLLLIDDQEEEEKEETLRIFPPVPLGELRTWLRGEGEPTAGAFTELCSFLKTVLLGYDIHEETLTSIEKKLHGYTFTTIEQAHSFLSLLQMFAQSGHVLNRNRILQSGSESALPIDVAFYEFCRQSHKGEDAIEPKLVPFVMNALSWYQVDSLASFESIKEPLYRLVLSDHNEAIRHRICAAICSSLIKMHSAGVRISYANRTIFEECAQVSKRPYPFVRDLAHQAMYLFFDRQYYLLHKEELQEFLSQSFSIIAQQEASHRETRMMMKKLVQHPDALQELLMRQLHAEHPHRWRLLECMIRRLYAGQYCDWRADIDVTGITGIRCLTSHHGKESSINGVMIDCSYIEDFWKNFAQLPKADVWEVMIADPFEDDHPTLQSLIRSILSHIQKHECVTGTSVTCTWRSPAEGERHASFVFHSDAWKKEDLFHIHPQVARRIELWRLQNFNLQRYWAHDRVYLFHGRAKDNQKDERIFICSEVLGRLDGADEPFWEFQQSFFEALRALRGQQSGRTKKTRVPWNGMYFYIHTPLHISDGAVSALANRLEPYTRDLGIREVVIRFRRKQELYEPPVPMELVLYRSGTYRLVLNQKEPNSVPVRSLDAYDLRVLRAQKYGYLYPYEIIRMLEGESIRNRSLLHKDMRGGIFTEYDFDAKGNFVPVERAYGQNTCGVVVGIISNKTRQHPDGMKRVWIGSDPTRSMGALAQEECKRIQACIQLARQLSLPIEWIPISAGAKIAMDSGTENLDWTAIVMRELVQFAEDRTHACSGMVNIIVYGTNVGAQSYWNAQANMLMHTKGILIMTLQGSMVLTGKKALDFSGSVSAEDERGIGGAERIMYPNGQAQVMASDFGEAYHRLFEWYRFTYTHQDEHHPKCLPTKDPLDRDVGQAKYRGHEEFEKIKDIFDPRTNSARKKPFAIRAVMHGVIDNDMGYLERFSGLRNGESSVVWESSIGGYPLTLLGIESRNIVRRGRIPMDGPDSWTGGTLFPLSAKKVSRAINAASGNRPIVVLANLSGFDGSPESLRMLQLEYGAEIGRSIVKFSGPIIFVVIGRYHGGAYVVFSKKLNPNLTALALDGSFASVIGGAPAAAVVFPRQVSALVEQDEEIKKLRKSLLHTSPDESLALEEKLQKRYEQVLLEQRGVVAQQFDAIHTVKRAIEQGSLDRIIQLQSLRAEIVSEIQSYYARKK